MRLCEHPDYEQAILQAADHFRDRGLRPSLIEKDYFVTEALRIVAATQGSRVIFKGGTSLPRFLSIWMGNVKELSPLTTVITPHWHGAAA